MRRFQIITLPRTVHPRLSSQWAARAVALLLLAPIAGSILESTAEASSALPTAAEIDASIKFATGTLYPLDYRTHSASAVDLDGGRGPDIIACRGDSILVLPNLGEGTFGPEIDLPVGVQVTAFATADMDGDGAPDLVLGGADANGALVMVRRVRAHLALDAPLNARRAIIPSAIAVAHSRLGDVRTILQTAGSLVAVEPGDTLRVAFRAAATAGARTDLFVAVTGGWSKLTTPGLRSIADKADLPRVFALYPARPNPFRASTRIRFDVPHPERVDIEIFDLQGRRVRSLMHGVQPAGMHDVSWDHVSNAGSRVAPGVYVYRMIAGTFHDQRKLVLLP